MRYRQLRESHRQTHRHAHVRVRLGIRFRSRRTEVSDAFFTSSCLDPDCRCYS